MKNIRKIQALSRLVRYFILVSTTEAGSGHPTSSLSATDIMTTLFFGGWYRFDPRNPKYENNDRCIFSKGHAAPLLYALYAVAGYVSEKELLQLRKFKSPLEGHPTPRFRYTEVAAGSLGQGLSAGVGMALKAKLDALDYRTFVLLGDSEMAEGSVWEAMASAAYYKLNNLVAIIDVNRLGQRGPTMYDHNVSVYQKKAEAFGWKTIVVDGHNIASLIRAFQNTGKIQDKPLMIIAKTLKGKGVSFLEDKNGWHGKALKRDELQKALQEIGPINKKIRGVFAKPKKMLPKKFMVKTQKPLRYPLGSMVATRKAYGEALVHIFPRFPEMVVLDAETSNSTYSDIFQKAYPERFFEMFIAEQNMVGVALGFARRGKIPFISTFAAFFSRAFDQIRMSQYSEANIKFCGSHAGVSIGEDGSSQMGLEDIAMFRVVQKSVVFYPSDAVSAAALVKRAAQHKGIVYIRSTRKETPVLYGPQEVFSLGGSKTLKKSKKDMITVVGAGITLHEAFKAYEILRKEGIYIRVIDLYSVKPLDVRTLRQALRETRHIITVEDHYPEGGIGEAVQAALPGALITSLAVRKPPRTGKPDELLQYENISSSAIVKTVKQYIKK